MSLSDWLSFASAVVNLSFLLMAPAFFIASQIKWRAGDKTGAVYFACCAIFLMACAK